MVLVPPARVVARPAVAGSSLIVATAPKLEPQVTEDVRFAVVLSVYVPVAVNCCVAPDATVGAAGVTLMEVRVFWVTANEVVPLTDPFLALMMVLPIPALLARPLALIVATVAVEEDQVVSGEEVKTCVELSVYVPVAMNCCCRPRAIEGFAGVTAIETSAAAPTVRRVEPDMEPRVAPIVVVPVLPVGELVAKPWLPALTLMVAMVRSEEVQWTVVVKTCVLSSV
jgi:hypothetical protein